MMHCTPCLGGNHRGCKVMLPLEWEDDKGTCICKCAERDATRLCNVERMTELKTQKTPTVRKRAGRPKGASKWTDARLRELCDLENQGLTSRQIGEVIGAHMDVVRTYLKKAREKGMR